MKRHRLIASTNLIKIENRWREISLDVVEEVRSDGNYEETGFLSLILICVIWKSGKKSFARALHPISLFRQGNYIRG